MKQKRILRDKDVIKSRKLLPVCSFDKPEVNF